MTKNSKCWKEVTIKRRKINTQKGRISDGENKKGKYSFLFAATTDRMEGAKKVVDVSLVLNRETPIFIDNISNAAQLCYSLGKSLILARTQSVYLHGWGEKGA